MAHRQPPELVLSPSSSQPHLPPAAGHPRHDAPPASRTGEPFLGKVLNFRVSILDMARVACRSKELWNYINILVLGICNQTGKTKRDTLSHMDTHRIQHGSGVFHIHQGTSLTHKIAWTKGDVEYTTLYFICDTLQTVETQVITQVMTRSDIPILNVITSQVCYSAL